MNTTHNTVPREDMLAALGEEPAAQAEPTDEQLAAPMADPSSHYSPGASTSVEDRALALLGSGVQAEQAALALGVTPGRIAQLLGNEIFSGKVADLRYKSLQQHNRRDNRYDHMEDLLLDKLQSAMPLMVRPDTIMKAISVVNGAKRRGQSAPQQITNQQNIINLTLPTIIAHKFSINIDNQVTKAGDQELHTMASGDLLKQVDAAEELRKTKYIEHTENTEQENVQEKGQLP